MKNYLVITLVTSEVQVLEEELGKANFQLSLDNKEVINKDNPQLRFNVKENRKQKINRFDDRIITIVSIKKLKIRRRIDQLLVSTPDLELFKIWPPHRSCGGKVPSLIGG